MATFGYTSQGTTDFQIYNSDTDAINNAGLFTLIENGDVTKISAYVREGIDRTSAAVAAIYSNNAGVPQNRLAFSSPVTIQGTSYILYDFTLSAALIAGDYWLSIEGQISNPSGGNQRIFVAGESSGGSNAIEVDGLHFSPYPTPSDPWNTTTDSFGSNKISIYATYTPNGGTPNWSIVYS